MIDRPQGTAVEAGERAPAAPPALTSALNEPWQLGSLHVRNRLVLAPLAGIGNWFVRLQAKRYGAGFAVSEMISSHAIHHGNRRTCGEMLKVDPAERVSGPVSVQLFGADPDVMRSAAAQVAARGTFDAIDINMGCPVPKVCKTGAGAALLDQPQRAVAVAKAAAEGSGLPVTVKLRCGRRPGERSGLDLAKRLVVDAGVAAIGMHPRSAAVHHKGHPDYQLVAQLVRELDGVPVILTGGLRDFESATEAFRLTNVAAVMIARGGLGNPWLFSSLLAGERVQPSPAEVIDELRWTIRRAVEHFGEPRAARWLRKTYPWYVTQLGLDGASRKRLQEQLQAAPTLRDVEGLLDGVPHALLSSALAVPLGA